MLNHGIGQVESHDRSGRRIKLENAADIECKLDSILGSCEQYESAHASNALDAFVGKVRESRTHFRKHAEFVAPSSELHAKECVGSLSPVGDAQIRRQR
jgi:hypothetical protein